MLQPKKSLGQNFLRDENVLQKIIQAANLKTDDLVLEIGPGEGALTEELAKKSGQVVAVEIDKNLSDNLQKKFHDKKNIKIINADILKINLSKLFSQHASCDTRSTIRVPRYKLVANIPYYITSMIIRFFLENKFPPQEMILMVQKEVAERIVSGPGQMSLLSVSVQYYAQPELLFYVDKKSFYPVPEVDSAVIKVARINLPRRQAGKQEESQDKRKEFFQIVRAGFSAKRKTLANNLSNSLHILKEEAEEKIKQAGLKPTCRAQELSIKDWKKLVSVIPAYEPESRI